MSNIKGVQDAQKVLHSVRNECGSPDLLYEAFCQVHSLNDPERLRSFVRHLAKVLERVA